MVKTVPASVKDRNALDRFMAGIPLERIRDELKFRTVSSAQAAILRALTAAERAKDIDTFRRTEIQRLDDLYAAIYPLAKSGDLESIDRALKISETRSRLVAEPVKEARSLVASFDRSIEALEFIDCNGKDEAIVTAGRAVAQQIDYAVAHGTGQEVTKALYLIPHLMNVLRELGATPEARREVEAAAPKKQDVDDLTAFRNRAFSQKKSS